MGAASLTLPHYPVLRIRVSTKDFRSLSSACCLLAPFLGRNFSLVLVSKVEFPVGDLFPPSLFPFPSSALYYLPLLEKKSCTYA